VIRTFSILTLAGGDLAVELASLGCANGDEIESACVVLPGVLGPIVVTVEIERDKVIASIPVAAVPYPLPVRVAAPVTRPIRFRGVPAAAVLVLLVRFS
jgi:hypothetical protein